MSEVNSFEGLLQNVESVHVSTIPAKICGTVLRKLQTASTSSNPDKKQLENFLINELKELGL